MLPSLSEPSVLGLSVPRLEGEAKVRGATRFVSDIAVAGLLHARLVPASEAHARIVAIDVQDALAVPGVVAVLTARDLPIVAPASGRTAEPLARDEVVYAGQPVALVVAETEAAASDGLARVSVDLEPLPFVLDLLAAMEPGAERVRAGGEGDGEDLGSTHAVFGTGGPITDGPAVSQNVVSRMRMSGGGDVERALAAGAARVSGRFETSWIYQASIETNGVTAWLGPEGELVLNSSTQTLFKTRQTVARTYGLPLDRVRVHAPAIGGSFGAKLMVLDTLVAGATLALRRPVRLALTRGEDLTAGNPSSGQVVDLEIGATSEGRLTGVSSRAVADRGANDEWGQEGISALLTAGAYRWDAHKLDSYGVLTNRVGMGAYRAPGAPQAFFALETLIDELAEQLRLDPIELRLANVLEDGEAAASQDAAKVFGARQCLERVREDPLWARRGNLPPGEGIGIALGYWPGALEPAAAACQLDADGSLTVVTAVVDISGTDTTFALIAAETFGLPVERVRVIRGDTQGMPHAPSSGGSKVTYTAGRAVERAAAEARERLLKVAAAELEIAPEDLEVVDGLVRPLGDPARSIPIGPLVQKALTPFSGHEPVEGHGTSAQMSSAPSAAAHLSHVRVDPETGAVTLLDHLVVQDVGRALNLAGVEGQMRGGTTQGIGLALLEELVHDEYGGLRTGSFADYAVPTMDVVPPIRTEVVEVPAPDGPHGAKGMGEASIAGVAAAVANAIHDAAGVRMRELPMTPMRVWAALRR